MKRLLIIGAGGHGKVVADAALLSGWDRVAFLDDRASTVTEVLGLPVIGEPRELREHASAADAAVVAVGAPARRLELQEACVAVGLTIATVIHPSASVSPFATVGSGSVVFAQAAINAGTILGRAGIVNTGATIDHDCRLGDGVHVSPGAHLAGGVVVGDRTWVGIGAAVRQGIEIGHDSVVGAGAAVVASVPPHTTVVGVPARRLKGTE
jgi:sugar O-acyltransferase (sialic acid O-acetyltransferase NeuD family)